MIHQKRVYLLTLLLTLSAWQFAIAQKKANVVILATGGTIAGAAASGTQAAYTSGAVTIDAMIAVLAPASCTPPPPPWPRWWPRR